MTWHTTDNPDDFLIRAGAFLRARPAQNTLLLTIAATLRQAGLAAIGEDNPVFGWWQPADGSVTGAYLQTPPRPMLLTRLPDAAVTSLAQRWAAGGHPPPGISADRATAEAFAAAWRDRTAAPATTDATYRLYRLGRLVDPVPPVPGRCRVADEADVDLLVTWWEQFHREIGEAPSTPNDTVREKVSYGGLRVWEIDGKPVAMAGSTRRTAGMVRVMAVYTPPELRRRGYAAAVTAAVTRAALDAGAAEVVLFTDLANPTSNAVYQRLGYRPVEDRIVLSFAA